MVMYFKYLKDQNIMKKIIIAVVIAAIAVGGYLFLTKPKAPIAGVAAQESALIYDGEVTKIDAATRTVTLKNKDGETSIVAGPEVKNFAEIKVGDHFDVVYELAVAIELVKVKNQGTTSEQVSTTTTTAPQGDKPGMITTNTVTATANVEAIDTTKNVVSLKGPQGNVFKVKVQNPDLMKDIAVNDQVKVVYTEAIAAVVSAPAAKK
jgi:plasmid maintenance system killer protein